MKLTFFGAAREVSGSMFLLEFDDGYQALIDCGSRMEDEEEPVRYEFGDFPFDASLVNVVFLTHAHIDHSGQLPNLFMNGFEGQILTTSPTRDLTEILLHDAASLNLSSLKKIERKHKKSSKWDSKQIQGLYLSRQVEIAMDEFVTLPFLKRFKFKDDGFVTFYPAGHLLGAAHIVIEVKDNGEWKKIGFSGDIGRKDFTLLVDPVDIPEVDFLVMESTYGNRNHTDPNEPEEIIRNIVEESCIKKKGRLIIPAFSVGRTQCLLFTLNKIYHKNNISPIKVFTDSPMAKATTLVYGKYLNQLNTEAKLFFEDTDSLFDFENLYYLESKSESEQASSHAEPCIIISSSGMIKGGRIEYHIQKNIENPYATVLMVGFAKEDSLGGRLLSGDQKEIFVRNKKLEVNAEIKKTDVFSGHGDQHDLLSFIRTQDKRKLKNVFLVHGDWEAMTKFSKILNEDGFGNVTMPERFQAYEL